MFRTLHTADLHVGMPFMGLGEAAEHARAARLRSLERLLNIADDVDAQAVLIAGDVFDDNQVDPGQVEKAAGLMNDRTRLPIYIIPGNHDPCTRDSVYGRSVWGQLREHVHVLTVAEPVQMAEGVVLYPCPLSRRKGSENPTAWIPPRDGEEIRIGLAHGSMAIQPGVGDDDFPIPLDAAHARGLDYLALGHWHSRMSQPYQRPDANTWYSGSHETTKFGETGSGDVLSVTIESPGSPPKVKAIKCGVLTWMDWRVDLAQQPVDETVREMRETPDPDNTLLRIRLAGRVPAEGYAKLAELSTMAQERFLACQIDETDLMPASVDKGLGDLLNSPYLKQTAEELEAIAAEDASRESGDEPINPLAARRALEILQEIAWRQAQ